MMYQQQQALAQQQAMAQQQPQYSAPQPAAPAGPPPGTMTDEKIAQLQRLGELKQSGILTDEEFAAQKAKILAS
jgi:hypothetical protein